MKRAFVVVVGFVLAGGGVAWAAGPNEFGAAPSTLSSPGAGAMGSGRSVGAAAGTAVGGAPTSQSLGAAPGTSIGPSGMSSSSLGAAPGTSLGGRP